MTTKVLGALGHNGLTLISEMDPAQRSDLQEAFNEKPAEDASPIVLVATFKLGACGLNLQKSCCYAAFLDQPLNDTMFHQALRWWIRRMKNPSPWVFVDDFVLENSFDEVIRRNISTAAIYCVQSIFYLFRTNIHNLSCSNDGFNAIMSIPQVSLSNHIVCNVP